jgi:hypothetical protein
MVENKKRKTNGAGAKSVLLKLREEEGRESGA